MRLSKYRFVSLILCMQQAMLQLLDYSFFRPKRILPGNRNAVYDLCHSKAL